ncbi:MAG: apolipoprotein N-acyltransferase [Deltaproteobacteria bacterium]|nr:apolipoprotein N-acyltransferase [Deltaproteobacteria bacterium]
MTKITIRNVLLAALSGLMLTASFAPVNLDWIAWISLIPLLISLEDKSLSDAFKIGLFVGLFHYLTLIYWIVNVLSRYGNINLILSLSALLLLSFYLAFYIALFALIVANFKNNRLSPFWGACIWVALEYARSYIMTGFPWCLLGYSQYSRLPLIQISDIAGVYGISFIIVLVNFALYNVVSLMIKKKASTYAIGDKSEVKGYDHNKHNGHHLRIIGIDAIFTFFLVGCVLVYGYSRLKEKADNNVKGKELRVMIVQGNIDQSLKWDSDFQEETLSIYKKLSLESADFKPQLIIWPETALPFFFQDASHLSKEVFEVARITNANILFGSPAYVKDKDSILYYNRAYMISKSRVFDYYDKVHLVPFGEYVPLKKCIPFVHRLVTAAGDFSTGKKAEPIYSPGLKIGALICFETIFPDIPRRFAAQGAELLVNLTNDAWFGRTSAPYQHLSMAVFRCVENRLPMARAANTGISAFILANGKIVDKSKLFAREILQKKIKLAHKKTFYSQLGNIFAILLTIATIIKFLWIVIKRR